MKVLFPIDEAYPLYKIGGLGDVGGSLPAALQQLDIDVRVALPRHPEISLDESFRELDTFSVVYNRQELPVTVWAGLIPNQQVPVYLFQEDVYLSQHTDASDNHADKFAVFALTVASWLVQPEPSFVPQLIHMHDWHTALIPVILKHLYKNQNFKFITSIHNLAYQGKTDSPVISRLGIDSAQSKLVNWDLKDNHLNILLQGLLHSDIMATVSPTYAQEVLTQEYGEHIEEILDGKKARLLGIINGISLKTFNPEIDPLIYKNYSINDATEGKRDNKVQLFKELELSVADTTTLIGFVGRVDPGQKGIQLIIEALNQDAIADGQHAFIFLGTGAPDLEQSLHQAAAGKPNVKIITVYDEALAAKIYAASDFMLIPSKYEPCGLVQMIAMRYGAIPLARKTGGLADTIIDGEDGFLFAEYSTKEFVESISRVKQELANQDTKNRIRTNAMNKDFSWNTSAQDYKKLYTQVILEEPIDKAI